MKKNQLESYCVPKCTLVYVETLPLMGNSFPSQHNPGQHGTGPSSAKQGMVWEDNKEEEEEEVFSIWED